LAAVQWKHVRQPRPHRACQPPSCAPRPAAASGRPTAEGRRKGRVGAVKAPRPAFSWAKGGAAPLRLPCSCLASNFPLHLRGGCLLAHRPAAKQLLLGRVILCYSSVAHDQLRRPAASPADLRCAQPARSRPTRPTRPCKTGRTAGRGKGSGSHTAGGNMRDVRAQRTRPPASRHPTACKEGRSAAVTDIRPPVRPQSSALCGSARP
jgi:hypothetical protein